MKIRALILQSAQSLLLDRAGMSLAGRPLLNYALDALAGNAELAVMVSPMAKQLSKSLRLDARNSAAAQVRIAEGATALDGLPFLPRDTGLVLLLREDLPFLKKECVAKLIAALDADEGRKTDLAMLMAGDDRDVPMLCAALCVRASAISDGASWRANPHRGDAPAPLTDRVLEEAAAQLDIPRDRRSVLYADAPREGLSAATPEGFSLAAREICLQSARAQMARGVYVIDPERTWIDQDVVIGAGTVVYPNNTLMAGTRIGEGCTLLPNSRLQRAQLGDDVTVESSVLIDCAVGSHSTVGPFAYLRPQTRVGEHCRVGDFVEIKNSAVGAHTKISHLTYVGDSDLGSHINLGCGVVFVNYDGKVKRRSTVEDHAFIGCNVNLVAPVRVGESAYIAAGSTVTEDVPGGALYIARARGEAKEGWVERRREAGKLD